MNFTHFALFFACFSTYASEHSDQSDSEIISSHAESDAEVTRGHSRQFGGRGHVTYSRDYLLSFAAKNTHMPSALPDLDFIYGRTWAEANLSGEVNAGENEWSGVAGAQQ